MASFLLFGLLELAGQFHDDLIGLAVDLDDLVHQSSQLVQADMHRGVGDPAIARDLIVPGIVAAGNDVPLQHLSVIGQLIEAFSRALVGMVPTACRHGLGISDYPFLKMLENRAGCGQAQPPVAVRQGCICGRFCMFRIEHMGLAKPLDQIGMFLVTLHGANAPDHFPLRFPIQRRPARPEPVRMGEAGADRVASDRITHAGFEREPLRVLQLEHPGKRGQFHRHGGQ